MSSLPGVNAATQAGAAAAGGVASKRVGRRRGDWTTRTPGHESPSSVRLSGMMGIQERLGRIADHVFTIVEFRCREECWEIG